MLTGVRQAQITFRMRRRRKTFVCVTIVWQAHFAFLQHLKKVQNCWWRDPRQLPFQKTAQTFPERLSNEIEDKIFKFQATVKKNFNQNFFQERKQNKNQETMKYKVEEVIWSSKAPKKAEVIELWWAWARRLRPILKFTINETNCWAFASWTNLKTKMCAG